MIAVKEIDQREMARFYGGRMFAPLKGYAARKRDLTVAVGGLMIGTDGNVWGFMDQKPGCQRRDSCQIRDSPGCSSWCSPIAVPASVMASEWL